MNGGHEQSLPPNDGGGLRGITLQVSKGPGVLPRKIKNMFSKMLSFESLFCILRVFVEKNTIFRVSNNLAEILTQD